MKKKTSKELESILQKLNIPQHYIKQTSRSKENEVREEKMPQCQISHAGSWQAVG